MFVFFLNNFFCVCVGVCVCVCVYCIIQYHTTMLPRLHIVLVDTKSSYFYTFYYFIHIFILHIHNKIQTNA